ncbi:MAG: DUF6882 domain-containing protein [Paracoccaceae bacterium]
MIDLDSASQRAFEGLFGHRLPRLARLLARPSHAKNGETGKPLRLINVEKLKHDLAASKDEILEPSARLTKEQDSYLEAEAWLYDPDRLILKFEYPGNLSRECRCQYLFAHNEKLSDLLWAWADARFTEREREKLRVLVGYGMAHHFDLLTTRQIFGLGKDWTWHLAGLATWILEMPYVLQIRLDEEYSYYVAAQYPELRSAK